MATNFLVNGVDFDNFLEPQTVNSIYANLSDISSTYYIPSGTFPSYAIKRYDDTSVLENLYLQTGTSINVARKGSKPRGTKRLTLYLGNYYIFRLTSSNLIYVYDTVGNLYTSFSVSELGTTAPTALTFWLCGGGGGGGGGSGTMSGSGGGGGAKVFGYLYPPTISDVSEYYNGIFASIGSGGGGGSGGSGGGTSGSSGSMSYISKNSLKLQCGGGGGGPANNSGRSGGGTLILDEGPCEYFKTLGSVSGGYGGSYGEAGGSSSLTGTFDTEAWEYGSIGYGGGGGSGGGGGGSIGNGGSQGKPGGGGNFGSGGGGGGYSWFDGGSGGSGGSGSLILFY